MAMGIPSIVNAGVGDVESIVQGAGAGYVINDFDRENFEKAADAIPALLKSHPSTIREEGEKIFSLEHGVESYRRCYEQILGNK